MLIVLRECGEDFVLRQERLQPYVGPMRLQVSLTALGRFGPRPFVSLFDALQGFCAQEQGFITDGDGPHSYMRRLTKSHIGVGVGDCEEWGALPPRVLGNLAYAATAS
jgi:hypothetical protein